MSICWEKLISQNTSLKLWCKVENLLDLGGRLLVTQLMVDVMVVHGEVSRCIFWCNIGSY